MQTQHTLLTTRITRSSSLFLFYIRGRHDPKLKRNSQLDRALEPRVDQGGPERAVGAQEGAPRDVVPCGKRLVAHSDADGRARVDLGRDLVFDPSRAREGRGTEGREREE